MIWVAMVIALAVVFGFVLASPNANGGQTGERASTLPDDDLAKLAELGTPETAEVLREQGVDLAALGYRPHGD